MRRLLVTGGAGFIGSNFVHHWLRGHGDDRLVVLDALTYAGNRANLVPVEAHAGFKFVQGNICDASLVTSLLRDERIDTLVHFAAETHVDRSISGPAPFIETNVIGTHTLLEAARKVWLEERLVERHRFHHVSTDEVYGSLGPQDPPFSETTPYAPNSPYSASKAASDHLVRSYHHTYGLQVTTTNCSNNYGPYHFPEKLIPLLIVNMLHGKALPIYGDGRNVRDWLHVSDHCRAIELVLEGGRVGEVYNIGGRAETENLELVRSLCEVAERVFDSRTELYSRYPQCPRKSFADLIRFVTDRPGHDRRYAIDCAKIERELGFSQRVTLLEGLRDTFTWYVENDTWWRPLIH
ncbi:MAG: dTDP-glucose 4,6-dehydratase [Sinobacteraceae bacterium]|nr:dTDP-glucose 4,6-dehydratase [Nevskiaceae bacterium]